MPKVVDLTNQRFGRLIAVRKADKVEGRPNSYWECLCDCGNTTTVRINNLKSGFITSCGCFKKEVTYSHGLYRTPEYKTWLGIKERCYNENNPDYPNYGARGIVMSDEWKESFEAFYRDMGVRPSSQHSIDRRENDKGYSKENCRWATYIEQNNNRRDNIYYELDGKLKTLGEWCRDLSLPYCTIYMRMKRGSSFEDAIADFIFEQ